LPTRPFTAGAEYAMLIFLPAIVTDSVRPLFVSADTKAEAAMSIPALIQIDFMIDPLTGG
jgi:hypothetical protein